MIEAANINTIADVRHGFFTREGGVSSGIYNGLNCGFGSNDDADSVRRNRTHVACALGLTPDRLVTVYQVHSPDVVSVDTPWTPDDAPKADAMVSARPGVALGILTADCAPVLFADRDNGVIGAAHAGWRGALGGVCAATVKAMEDLGAKAESIDAAIGPTISHKNYEVGPEFRDAFLAEDQAYDAYFDTSSRDSHFMFDLPAFLENRLGHLNLHSVENTNLCTYADETGFFSYRRATHRKEPDYGRQISAITLGPDAFIIDETP